MFEIGDTIKVKKNLLSINSTAYFGIINSEGANLDIDHDYPYKNPYFSTSFLKLLNKEGGSRTRSLSVTYFTRCKLLLLERIKDV